MRLYNLFGTVFVLVLAGALKASAQLLPPLQPEQDGCHALKVCGNFLSPYSYTGFGTSFELTQAAGACFTESNSVWLQFTIATPGTVVFTITPVNPINDYDFAVFNMTNTPCDSVSMQQMVRCESVDIWTSPGGLTGLADTGQLTVSGPGSTSPGGGAGQPFVAALNAVAGETYYLLIDNFQAPWFNPALSGFGIDFSGSTATFAGDGNPRLDSLSVDKCNQLTVYLDRQVKCNSIAPDGSDFILSPHAANAVSATGNNCIANGYTQAITIVFDGGLPAGNYSLKAATGSDGNTLLGLCDEALLLPDSLTATGLQLDAGPDDTITGCHLTTHSLAGSLSNTATGTGYSILWTPAASIFSGANTLNPVVFPGTSNSVYVLTVTTPADQVTCVWQDSVTVTYGDSSVIASFQSADTICSNTELFLTNTSAGSIGSCLWSFGDGTSDTVLNPVHSFDTAGSFEIVLQASNSLCADTAARLVLVRPLAPYLEFNPSDTVICEGHTIYFSADSIVSGDPFMLQWDFGDGSVIPYQSPAAHAYDSAGVFTISLQAIPGACNDSSFRRSVTIKPFPKADLGPDTSMCLHGPAIALEDHSHPYGASATWLWNTGDTTRAIIARHPGVYTVRVTDAGCETSDSIEIFKDCYIDIPNSFTPNGDGTNDYFFPRELLSSSLTGFRMSIFNRWGQQIFETRNVDGRGWDGKFNGAEQPQGVYVYLIEATVKDGKQERYQGNITLIR